MTRLAKAMSAFTFGRSGDAAGRDASSFAPREALLCVDGSGARSHRHSRGGLLAAGLGLAVLIALTFSSAAKAETYVQGLTFCAGVGAGAGECEQLKGGVAVDQSSRNVYLIDAGSASTAGNFRINQFRSNGTFVRAWGVDVIPSNGSVGFEVCTVATGCKAGVTTGPGSIGTGARSIAVDSTTHVVYVGFNNKVAYFDGGSGAFLGEFTQATGIAPPPAPQPPQAFAAATGIAVDTSDPDQHYLYYAATTGVIDKFTVPEVSDGSVTAPPAYVCQITGLETASATECNGAAAKDGAFNGLSFASKKGANLAVDSEGNVVVAEAVARNVVSIFSSAGGFVQQLSVTEPEAVAVGRNDHLFVSVESVKTPVAKPNDGGTRILELDPGAPVPPLSDFGNGIISDANGGSLGLAVADSGIVYVATNTKKQLYGFAPKPAGSHLLNINDAGLGGGSFTCDIGSGAGTCLASYPAGTTITIEPIPNETSAFSGWSVAGQPGACPGIDPCTIEEIDADTTVTGTFSIFQRRLSVSVAGSGEVTSVPGAIDCATGNSGTCEAEFDHGTEVTLEGAPGPDSQAAHWSGCASILVPNRCVVLLNGDREVTATFASMESLDRRTDCPNQGFRLGIAAFLPDCRAYEMVSPIDKNGGDIVTISNPVLGPAINHESLDLSSGDGDSITYSSKTAFGDVVGAPWSSQYLADRDGEEGWSTRGISPPRESFVGLPPGTAFNGAELSNEFRGFTEDLSVSWLVHDANRLEVGCAPENSLNIFQRDNLTDSYRELNCVPFEPRQRLFDLQGFSANGCFAVFGASGKLTADANESVGLTAPRQLYQSNCNGPLRHVSKLPGPGGAPGANCTQQSVAGTIGLHGGEGRSSRVQHAFSDDAHRLYWRCGSDLYLRTDPDLGVEGDEKVAQIGSGTQFDAAASDGSAVLFREGTSLRVHDAVAETTATIAGGVGGVGRTLLGASDDARRAYFVSTQILTGTQRNSVGDAAIGGQNNLYLYEEDEGEFEFTFVARLANTDLSDTVNPSPVNDNGPWRFSRVSSDGKHAAFISYAPLTGYDNTDADSGAPDAEVFLYDAVEDSLRCVSCNPTGARPSGRSLSVNSASTNRWGAAWIPGWMNQFHAPRALAEDGELLFFQSFDALVPRDANGRDDVYQWRRAGSEAECRALGAELFVPKAGGCISLISSGDSASHSDFVDADHDGDNAFFKTSESLVAQDPGSVDIYVARVGGGFPAQSTPPGCEGEACQSPPASPEFSNPSSSTFEGPGNRATGLPARCNRKQVRRGNRCVAKRKLAKRACAKRRGKAKQRCVNQQMRRLSTTGRAGR